MTRRFWVGSGMAVPLAFITTLAHVPGGSLPQAFDGISGVWIRAVLATPIVI
jgi:hypothetical protein